jgi:hypothetical protein
MDFGKILAEIRREQAAIEQAILSLERLAGRHRKPTPKPDTTIESPDSGPDSGGMPPGGSSGPTGGTPSAAGVDPGPFRNRDNRSLPSEPQEPELETAGTSGKVCRQ